MRSEEEIKNEIDLLISNYEFFSFTIAFKRLSKSDQDDLFIKTFREVNKLYKEMKGST